MFSSVAVRDESILLDVETEQVKPHPVSLAFKNISYSIERTPVLSKISGLVPAGKLLGPHIARLFF